MSEAEEYCKGSTLVATLCSDNFPFGMDIDLKKDLYDLMQSYHESQLKKMPSDDICSMKLGEQIELKIGIINWIVTRVAGGWIYSYVRLDSESMISNFVPFNNEFQQQTLKQ